MLIEDVFVLLIKDSYLIRKFALRCAQIDRKGWILKKLSKSIQTEEKVRLKLARLNKLRHETRKRRNRLLQRDNANYIKHDQGQASQQISLNYLNLIR